MASPHAGSWARQKRKREHKYERRRRRRRRREAIGKSQRQQQPFPSVKATTRIYGREAASGRLEAEIFASSPFSRAAKKWALIFRPQLATISQTS